MTAVTTNRTLLNTIMTRLFGGPKDEIAPKVPTPAAYNPLAGISLSDLGMLRRTLANAAHLSNPHDAAILFDYVDDEAYVNAREGQEGELSELVRAADQFTRNEFIGGAWGFGTHVVRSKITGEPGLSIGCDVPECTLAQLHALPEYEVLRTENEIPTTVACFFNYDEAVDRYEFSARCFLRIDQLSEINMVRRMLSEIQKGLRASAKAPRRRRAA
ncbi:hypothetical protein HFN89_05590 [Rhizobium laguerreae]|nr:hypothetical protein [Rhizobium laguerreae]